MGSGAVDGGTLGGGGSTGGELVPDGSVGRVVDSSGPGVDAVPPGVDGPGLAVEDEGVTPVSPVVGTDPVPVVDGRPGRKVGGEVAAWLWVTEPPRLGEVDVGEGVGVVLTPGGPAGEGG